MSMDFEVKSVHLLVSVFVGKFHDFILVLQTKPYYAQCGSHSVSVHSMVNGLGGSSLQNTPIIIIMMHVIPLLKSR